MMKSKKVQASESENEFDVDEPEEVVEYSEDEWTPTAVAKTPVKRGRPAKSTPARKKKKQKVSNDEPEKERGSKAEVLPPAPVRTSARAMMKSKKVLASESENEFDVDEPEEVGEYSDDEWTPSAVAKTPVKRGRPAKSTPARKKKKPKVSNDEHEKKIIPEKERGSKAEPLPPAPIPTSARGRGRATKVLKVVPEEELEDDEEKIPEKLMGASYFGGQLMFLVKWSGIAEADIIPSKEANLKWPQIVINYYEKIIKFVSTS